MALTREQIVDNLIETLRKRESTITNAMHVYAKHMDSQADDVEGESATVAGMARESASAAREVALEIERGLADLYDAEDGDR